MRLQETILRAGSVKQRVIRSVAGAVMGGTPDVMSVLMYRPELFGGPYGEAVNDSLRGASRWSVGEREAFALTVSRAHGCKFCVRSHAASAKAELKREGASFSPEHLDEAPTAVRAARDLLVAFAADASLEKPIEALRNAGVDDKGIEDLVDIATNFTMINRLADALDFHVPDEAAWKRIAAIVHHTGYRSPGWRPPK